MIRSQSRHSVLTVRTNRSAKAFAWGRLHRRVDHPDSFAAEHLVEASGELAVAIMDQEARPLENVGEVEIARLLDTRAP
jgi:hypothetical protein